MHKDIVTLRSRTMRIVLGVSVALGLASTSAFGASGPAAAASMEKPAWTSLDFSAARSIPVQYNGRTMPLDTLARQIVWQVTGRQAWQGYDPVGLMLAWTWQGKDWLDQPMVLVNTPELQKKVGLAANEKRFSCNQLQANAKLTHMAMGEGMAEHLGARRETPSRCIRVCRCFRR